MYGKDKGNVNGKKEASEDKCEVKKKERGMCQLSEEFKKRKENEMIDIEVERKRSNNDEREGTKGKRKEREEGGVIGRSKHKKERISEGGEDEGMKGKIFFLKIIKGRRNMTVVHNEVRSKGWRKERRKEEERKEKSEII